MKTVHYFKALADETRLRLFNLLLHYELNVNEIVVVMSMGQSRISRHLKILTDNNLLSFRRDGSFVYYHNLINNENKNLVEFIKQSVKTHKEFTNDLARANQILKERKDKTKKFFNSVAEHWDKLKKDIFGNFDLVKTIKDKIEHSEVIVDLGCGTGELLNELKTKAKMAIGVDSSPKMLEQAKLRLTSNYRSVELRLGELEHLPMKNEEADYAVVNMVLHHLPIPATGISEAHRILKEKGCILIVDFDKHDLEMIREKYGGPWLGFDKRQIKAWLLEAGFKILEVERFKVRYGLTVNLFIAKKS